MRLRYKQLACTSRTLMLMLWFTVACSIYLLHNASQKIHATRSRYAKRENDDVVRRSEDYTREWTSVTTTDDPKISQQRAGRPPKTLTGTPITDKPVTGEPVTDKSVTAALVSGRPIVVEPNSSASTKPTSLTEKTTKDPMDVYSDMGGIVVSQSNASTPVNPHPFNYTLNPEKTCEVEPSSDVFLLVYIHTRPQNIKQRELIRSTWGDVRNYAVTVRRIFVMGLPEGDFVQESVKLESALYHDIVQENFLDTYRNLTYKAVGALRWVKDYCSNARFVLKTDDDAFVNMHILLDLLVSKHKAGVYGPRSLICRVWTMPVVYREGKWGVSLLQRKHPTWPTYCQGLAYILTPEIAADLYNASFYVPFLWIDDIYVTGFLAKKIGMAHTQIFKYFIEEGAIEERLNGSGLWQNVLFSHVLNSDRIRWAWNRVIELKDNSSTPSTIIGDSHEPSSSENGSGIHAGAATVFQLLGFIHLFIHSFRTLI